jgi:hypothetical protein
VVQMHPLYLLARPGPQLEIECDCSICSFIDDNRLTEDLLVKRSQDKSWKTAYSGARKFRPKNSNNVSKLLMFTK